MCPVAGVDGPEDDFVVAVFHGFFGEIGEGAFGRAEEFGTVVGDFVEEFFGFEDFLFEGVDGEFFHFGVGPGVVADFVTFREFA